MALLVVVSDRPLFIIVVLLLIIIFLGLVIVNFSLTYLQIIIHVKVIMRYNWLIVSELTRYIGFVASLLKDSLIFS